MRISPSIVGVASAYPDHHYDQATITRALGELWSGRRNLSRLTQLHEAVQVKGRYLSLARDEYVRQRSFTDRNDAFIRVGLQVGQEASQQTTPPSPAKRRVGSRSTATPAT